MTARVVALLASIEAGWAWLYTAGIEPESAQRRRAEIASHSYEFLAWAREARGERAIVVHAAIQFVLGIPADITWRLGLGRRGVSRRSWLEATLAALIAFGVLVSLPAATALAVAYAGSPGEPPPTLQVLTAIHLVGTLLMLAAPGLLAMGGRPVAGSVLVVLGAASAMLALWWMPMLAIVSAIGAVAAAAAAWRRERSVSLDN